MKFVAQAQGDRLVFGDYSRAKFKDWIKNNQGARIELRPLTPESRNQRKFYHGAVLTLWVYLDGNDYRDSDVIEHYHQEAKKEFNGEIIIRAGKEEKIGKSTKGQLNDGYIDRIIDFLEEQYGIDRTKVLNPEHYKDFMDRVYSDGKYETYIDYLKELKLLT